jgi:threonine dehydratase
MLELADVEAAQRRLAGRVRHTPLVAWTVGGTGRGRPTVWLKAENLQFTGAFKARGAMNRLLMLQEEAQGAAVAGVATASSGNHGQALAWAGAQLGIPVTVVVPEDASPPKVAGALAWGATVERCGHTSGERIARAQELARERGLAYVPSYDDLGVMAGQGSLGLEIVADLPAVREVAVQVGGGGLLSGVVTAIKGLRPDVRVVGVEPEGSSAAYQSWRAGRRLELEHTETMADGLRTLGPGEHPWEVLRSRVDAFVTVSESAIGRAVRTLALEAKIVAEPSGAVTAAAVLEGVLQPHDGLVLVVSGGNADPAVLERLMAEVPEGSAS